MGRTENAQDCKEEIVSALKGCGATLPGKAVLV